LYTQSIRDLICKGVDAGHIDCLSHSALQDPESIRSILKDALDVRSLYDPQVLRTILIRTIPTGQAYHHLEEIVEDTKKLTRENICRIHSFLMRNSRVSLNLDSYASPGSTRTLTRKTLVISGMAKIQSCPYPAVDDELDDICKMGVVSTLNNLMFRTLHNSVMPCCPLSKKIISNISTTGPTVTHSELQAGYISPSPAASHSRSEFFHIISVIFYPPLNCDVFLFFY
jgi:hypothetical protein